MAVTLYLRSDQHTINTITAYKLLITNSSSIGNIADSDSYGIPSANTSYHEISDVDIVHSDGSITAVGSGIRAQNTRTVAGTGEQNANWSCPETSMLVTDAIRIRVYTRMESTPSLSANTYFITEQLGWTKLKATTWTFYKWTEFAAQLIDPPHDVWQFGTKIQFGNSAPNNSRITNIDFESYIDVGLRIKSSGGIVTIGAQTLVEDEHKLRIRKGGTTYGIPLITPGGADDSGIRIYDGSSVKALPKI